MGSPSFARTRSISTGLLLVALLAACGPGPEQQVIPKPSGPAPQASPAAVQTAAPPPSSSAASAPARVPAPIASFPARARELYESIGDEYMVVTQGDAATRAARKMFELVNELL